MCKILELLFRPKPGLPHPEEKVDYKQTLDNVAVAQVLGEWMLAWGVPEEYNDYWREAIVITVTLEIWVPAQTWEEGGKRHLAVRPEWLNPGVIAHEQAHNSYSLLTNDEKSEFEGIYIPMVVTEPLIKLLYSKNAYGLTSTIEGHAELYRFLGSELPESLKRYYPKLF